MNEKQMLFTLEDIDFEDKTKRKENEKHYKLKDGSYVATVHNDPIHYWDKKDNCYHTVDNTLIETDNTFENTKGAFKVSFAKTPKNNTSIMRMEKDDKSIEWEYIPTRKRNFDKAKIKHRIDDRSSPLPTLNSVGLIRYPEICKNVDLEYDVTPTGIKENIVIKAKKRSYKFTFKLKVTGYEVREYNGELLFFHTNASGEEKAEYRMPKLFMTDRNGKRCDNVRFTLEKRSDAEYIFTVIPDAKWINDEYRIFPVMVDPTLEYITLQSNKIESYSVCSNGSVYYTDSTIRKIGFENFTNEYITYFNLPKFELPIGYMLKKAGLTLHVNEARARYFDIFEFSVNDDYGFGYFTSFYKPNGSPDINYLSGGGVDPYIDITPLYQKWLDNNSNYYSMLIKTSFDSCNYCSEVFEFNSENSAYDKPTLMVVYEAESIERKYNPEHSCLDIDLGIAGKGKIDLYNGGFVLQTPLVSKGNKSVPLSYYVYNSMAKNGIWSSPKYFDFNNGTYTDIYENTYTLNFLERFKGVDRYYNKDGLYYECTGTNNSLFMDLNGNKWKEYYGTVTFTRALENSNNCSDCNCCPDCDCGDRYPDCDCGDCCPDCDCGDCYPDFDCGDCYPDFDCGDCYPDCDCGDGDCAVTPVKPVINYAGTVLAQSEYFDDVFLRYDTVTYGNNRGTRVYRNANGDVTNIQYKNGTSWKDLTNITYDGNGKVISATDVPKNVRYEYEFNKRGNLKCIYKVTPYNRAQAATSAEKYVEYYYYDGSPYTAHPDLLRGYSYSDIGRVYYYSQKFYGDKMSLDGEVAGIEALSFGKENFTFDSYSRVATRTLKNTSGTVIDYSEYEYSRTNLPITVSKKPRTGENAREESYTYDAAGNIIGADEYGSIDVGNGMDGQPVYDTVNSESHSYEYDKLNRLIKEVFDGVETTYTYDEAGNIITKTTLDKTYVYEYNNSRWGDQLTGIAINGDSQSFTYNSIGLPNVYRGKNLTWNQRNLLGRFDGNTFTYDAKGMRLTKNGITYEYFGNNLIKETRGTDVIEYVDGTSGKLGFVYNGIPYYYIRNVFGDVKGIIDANGNLVAEYKYDAWGNHKVFDSNGNENSSSTFIGNINPIRYRGYYYDTETGLYYLQTRYYDPEIGRFISPDSTKYLEPATLGGLNLYAYCNNNPVMYADPSGTIYNIAIGAGFGAIIGALSSIILQFVRNPQSIGTWQFWAHVGVATVAGAIGGAFAATTLGLGHQIAINSILGATSGIADTAIDGVNIVYDSVTGERQINNSANFWDYIGNAALGAGLGALGGRLGGKGTGTNHLKNSLSRAIKNGNWKYYFSQITYQSQKCGVSAMPGIIKSTIPNITYNSFKIVYEYQESVTI